MKAVVLTGIRKIEIVEQPVPPLQHPTDVLLRIVRAGICGSDLHYYTQGRIGDQIVRFPFCVGHECSAVVEDVGKQVTLPSWLLRRRSAMLRAALIVVVLMVSVTEAVAQPSVALS